MLALGVGALPRPTIETPISNSYNTKVPNNGLFSVSILGIVTMVLGRYLVIEYLEPLIMVLAMPKGMVRNVRVKVPKYRKTSSPFGVGTNLTNVGLCHIQPVSRRVRVLVWQLLGP